MKLVKISLKALLALSLFAVTPVLAGEESEASKRVRERNEAMQTENAKKAVEGLKQPGQTKEQKKEARKGGVISTPTSHVEMVDGKEVNVKSPSANSKIQKDPRKIEKENVKNK